MVQPKPVCSASCNRLGRMAEPVDIGNACVYLSSDQAAYISGVNLTVHGGGEKPAFLDAANVKHD